jgi:uncharacterized Zn-binding protein involved in type VI secretion
MGGDDTSIAGPGSPNVFVNGISVSINTDTTNDSPIDPDPPNSFTGSGSPNVFVNGIPVLRLNDQDNDGDPITGASPNVFAN